MVKHQQSDTARIHRIFEAQQQHYLTVGNSSVAERKRKLKKLLKTVMNYRSRLQEALYKDFHKPAFEVDAVEILPTVGAIKHAIKHLGRWVAPHRAPTPLMFAGSTSWVRYESKGVCLIISPWNFPFNITLIPLVSAIAAGNTAIIKPSEFTPHTAALMEEMLAEVFDEKEVAVVQGEVDTAQELLSLPFNHIFFTGSPAVGKIVMEAAAKNLASVTLELGGKSPTVIDETADLKKAVRRIALAKWANSGQICTTCDYLLVHESREQELLDLLKATFEEFAGGDAATSGSYTHVVNEKHFHRVCQLLDDAKAKGAKVVAGGETDEKENFIAPTVLTNVDPKSRVMQEEIFGPLLPVLTFKTLQEAVDIINAGERPLTMNIFSKRRKNIDFVLAHTRAGGTTINNATMHFYNHDLPFGGVNNSGIGKAHGWYGFVEFSNARAIYRQDLPSVLDLMTPPYTRWKERIIELAIKYL
ncbi:MAG: aldehyde dehydrogenase family protein [Saprospirales bacterium]|nr:aldehyde dehydrogenase family protein [Saprospirales bacterium]